MMAGLAPAGIFAAQACAVESGERADAPSKPSWRLVWADEFAGDALDLSKWTVEESCCGGGNNERQCYTDRPENVRLDEGVLHISARPEKHTGRLYPAHYQPDNDEAGSQDYTSGKIVSLGKGDFKYGRFSARMKLPAGQGAWSAFWMMPSENHYGGWPLSGEIDIMEAVNLDTPCGECAEGVETRTSGALHFGDTAPANTYRTAKAAEAVTAKPTEEWRVYAVEWAEGVMQWLVDGQVFMKMTEDDWFSGAESAANNPYAPFDRQFYLNINLAAGGNLAEKSNGRGFDENAFPADLLVDWVRVEQCDGDRETGRACLSDQQWTGRLEGPPENEAP